MRSWLGRPRGGRLSRMRQRRRQSIGCWCSAVPLKYSIVLSAAGSIHNSKFRIKLATAVNNLHVRMADALFVTMQGWQHQRANRDTRTRQRYWHWCAVCAIKLRCWNSADIWRHSVNGRAHVWGLCSDGSAASRLKWGSGRCPLDTWGWRTHRTAQSLCHPMSDRACQRCDFGCRARKGWVRLSLGSGARAYRLYNSSRLGR